MFAACMQVRAPEVIPTCVLGSPPSSDLRVHSYLGEAPGGEKAAGIGGEDSWCCFGVQYHTKVKRGRWGDKKITVKGTRWETWRMAWKAGFEKQNKLPKNQR